MGATKEKVETKLPKDFKKKWLKALRSGKYAQGTRCLKQIETIKDKKVATYCCLGVACHIAGASSITDKQVIQNGLLEHNGKKIKSINKVPKLLHGIAGDNRIVNKLSYMNDNRVSFKKIADWIEKKL
jgi:hypothetical protein